MTKQTKTIEKKTQKEIAETIIDNTLLNLRLSDIVDFNYELPPMTAYEVHEVKAPEKIETLEAIQGFEILEAEKNTLSVDNNVNALNINIIVAFCWIVNYVVESFVRNICNYLESPVQPTEHAEPRFNFDINDLRGNDPAEFNYIEPIGNTIHLVEINLAG
ncbi:hypothetical protein H6P87_00599 [Rickettsia tillamookensis]|uniref:Uncharacterized protein n=1 Tax=Rickettsia tillamookensis TaxID=2761623 RepID=A0A9E6SQE4_9RICK|nr:hypothetical protein [Rickettsia tillamookensis]QQV75054.1 hypothetical protein H6P87_00599 [Rickettsia tillamookensis]